MQIRRSLRWPLSQKSTLYLVNCAGICYTWIIMLVLLYQGMEACPYLEGDQCSYYVAFGVFVVVECALNFFCFHIFAYRNRTEHLVPNQDLIRMSEAEIAERQSSSDSSRSIGDQSSKSENGEKSISISKFCSQCDRTVPTRSHHCYLCQYCVVKNDHHCFALGGCVGLGNQRYFVVFLFWTIIGGFYGAWMTARYLNRYVTPFWPWGIFDYFFPLACIKWLIFRHVTLGSLGLIAVVTGGYTGGSGALMFFVLQWILIVKGQTMHEAFQSRKKNRNQNQNQQRVVDHDRSPLWLRIEHVFGPYFLLQFLIPLPFRHRLDEGMKKFLYECQLKKV